MPALCVFCWILALLSDSEAVQFPVLSLARNARSQARLPFIANIQQTQREFSGSSSSQSQNPSQRTQPFTITNLYRHLQSQLDASMSEIFSYSSLPPHVGDDAYEYILQPMVSFIEDVFFRNPESSNDPSSDIETPGRWHVLSALVEYQFDRVSDLDAVMQPVLTQINSALINLFETLTGERWCTQSVYTTEPIGNTCDNSYAVANKLHLFTFPTVTSSGPFTYKTIIVATSHEVPPDVVNQLNENDYVPGLFDAFFSPHLPGFHQTMHENFHPFWIVRDVNTVDSNEALAQHNFNLSNSSDASVPSPTYTYYAQSGHERFPPLPRGAVYDSPNYQRTYDAVQDFDWSHLYETRSLVRSPLSDGIHTVYPEQPLHGEAATAETVGTESRNAREEQRMLVDPTLVSSDVDSMPSSTAPPVQIPPSSLTTASGTRVSETTFYVVCSVAVLLFGTTLALFLTLFLWKWHRKNQQRMLSQIDLHRTHNDDPKRKNKTSGVKPASPDILEGDASTKVLLQRLQALHDMLQHQTSEKQQDEATNVTARTLITLSQPMSHSSSFADQRRGPRRNSNRRNSNTNHVMMSAPVYSRASKQRYRSTTFPVLKHKQLVIPRRLTPPIEQNDNPDNDGIDDMKVEISPTDIVQMNELLRSYSTGSSENMFTAQKTTTYERDCNKKSRRKRIYARQQRMKNQIRSTQSARFGEESE